jgi:hypothetical protein
LWQGLPSAPLCVVMRLLPIILPASADASSAEVQVCTPPWKPVCVCVCVCVCMCVCVCVCVCVGVYR